MFFFSPNNVFKFSVAIEQIKGFFHNMKTKAKLPVLESLNFKFKHGLVQRRDKYTDMENGETLQPLMEKGWKLITSGPYMTVSDVNWCFRTDFDDTEIEMLESDIFWVKPADIYVNYGQYDISPPKIPPYISVIYLCIGMFIDESQVKEDVLNIPKEGPPRDKGAALSEEITVNSERGLILTVTLIAVILLLVILYKVKQTNGKNATRGSS